MTVLIIAPDGDLHAAAVGAEIERVGGSVIVADLSSFPQGATMGARYVGDGGRRHGLRFEDGACDLDEIGSIWWRRGAQLHINLEVAGDTQRPFGPNEAQEALAGLWYALDVFWVNDPEHDRLARRTIAQLRSAQDIGLRTADTLICNDPDEAMRFIEEHGHGRVAYRAFSILPGPRRTPRLLRPAELKLIDCVRYAPVILQEHVDALCDVRAVVVGDRLFAGALQSGDSGAVGDGLRAPATVGMEAIEVPEEVSGRLMDLVRRLGLVYGAIDLRLRSDGEWVFMELDPAGEWLSIEHATGQPITAAMADLLVRNGVAGSAEKVLRLG
ncbi:MAG: MvdC/MvdD family ATP grasp protein [Actinomycetota bacterium]